MINNTVDILKINKFLYFFDTKIEKIEEFDKFYFYSYDNKILGFLNFSYIYDRIELNYIYVDEKYRKQGIASKLMDFLLEFFEFKKCLNITLEVNEKNISAIKMYEKYGFKKVAIRKNYYGKDNGILMMKEMI